MDFGRLLTAMVTAFDSDLKLSLERQQKLIEHLIHTGTQTIVVAGTTGESPTLTKDEKLALIKLTVEEVKGKAKVIAGTGSNNTAESIEMTKKAEALGVDGIMLVNPYYNRPSQEGLYQHMKTIAQSTALPIMLYNIPGRSAVNMSVETVVRLAQLPNIKMMKEASGDLAQMTEIIKETADDFVLYSGDDNLTLPVLSIGGYGVVSVAAHVVGQEMTKMITHYVEGRTFEATRTYLDIYSKCKALFSAPSPVPVKAVLEKIGIETGAVRLPLVPLTDEQRGQLYKYFT